MKWNTLQANLNFANRISFHSFPQQFWLRESPQILDKSFWNIQGRLYSAPILHMFYMSSRLFGLGIVDIWFQDILLIRSLLSTKVMKEWNELEIWNPFLTEIKTVSHITWLLIIGVAIGFLTVYFEFHGCCPWCYVILKRQASVSRLCTYSTVYFSI